MPKAATQIPAVLTGEIRNEVAIAVPPPFLELANRVRAECGEGVVAILLYGSCLRTNDAEAGVVDLFVIVSGYDRAPGGRAVRALNAILPPGVYYLDLRHGSSRLRCKYAVISLEHFEAGTREWLQPYLWARFAQPSRLLLATDDSIRERVCRALAIAVVSFLRNVTPAMTGETLTTRDIWRRGLASTFGVELRPEGRDRPARLTEMDESYCERITGPAAVALPDLMSAVDAGSWRLTAGEPARRRCLRDWRLRRWQGTILSVLRWIKAAFTFSGGVDYAAWKIERHTGVRIEVTERLRRHPLVYGWPVLWKLWRSGALR